jgi:hypothetical protein
MISSCEYLLCRVIASRKVTHFVWQFMANLYRHRRLKAEAHFLSAWAIPRTHILSRSFHRPHGKRAAPQ